MAALKYFFSLFMIPISFIMAGAGIIAFMAAGISPEESEWMTYMALGIPIILLINLVITIYWAISKKWWVLVPIAAILLNLNYITSIFQLTLSSPSVPTEKSSIRIATYNVGNFVSWDKQNTQQSISYFFHQENPDIICLQEYGEKQKINADSLSQLIGLPYHAVEYLPDSKISGSAIFSKFPILRQGQLPFNSPTNDAMWADIQAGNQIIRVINCHLQTTNFNRKRRALANPALSNAAPEQLLSVYQDISSTLLKNSQLRAKQAEMIRQLIDTTSGPVFVCGDFNDPPSTYTYHQIKGSLKDSFRSKGQGYGYTFRGIHRLLRIDYILYSSEFTCIAYHSTEKEWSDHNPIICEFYL